MDDILVQSTQPLLLPGEQSLSSLGLSILVKFFLVLVFFVVFSAFFIAAWMYCRELIRQKQSNNQEHILYILKFRLSRIFSHLVLQGFQTKAWNS